MPVQACVAAGKPLLARQLTKINADSRIVTRLEATLVSLRSLHVSGLDGSACERAQAHNCTKLLQAMDLCVGGAFNLCDWLCAHPILFLPLREVRAAITGCV